MSNYPTTAQITERFSDEELAQIYEEEADYYYNRDVEIAKIEETRVSADMLTAWSLFAKAVQLHYEDEEIILNGLTIQRHRNAEEKREQAISWLKSKLHDDPDWELGVSKALSE